MGLHLMPSPMTPFFFLQASYGVEDPEYAVTQLAQTTMRSELGKLSLDKVFRVSVGACVHGAELQPVKKRREEPPKPFWIRLKILHLVSHPIARQRFLGNRTEACKGSSRPPLRLHGNWYS